MLHKSCPFCEHVNPADSKFCNGCGGALHLVPCPRCGAVSDVTATSCYQCHSLLPGHGTDAPDAAQAAAEISKLWPRPRSRVIIGTAVIAAISALGYYSYHQRSLVGVPQPPAASSETSGRGGSTGAGVIQRDAEAGDSALGKADDSAGPAGPATAPPEPAKSRDAKDAAAQIARSKAISEGRASERGPSRPEACTEAAATLGLCTRPEVTAVGEAGQQEPPRQEPCTVAVAILGLCTPTPTTARP